MKIRLFKNKETRENFDPPVLTRELNVFHVKPNMNESENELPKLNNADRNIVFIDNQVNITERTSSPVSLEDTLQTSLDDTCEDAMSHVTQLTGYVEEDLTKADNQVTSVVMARQQPHVLYLAPGVNFFLRMGAIGTLNAPNRV